MQQHPFSSTLQDQPQQLGWIGYITACMGISQVVASWITSHVLLWGHRRPSPSSSLLSWHRFGTDRNSVIHTLLCLAAFFGLVAISLSSFCILSNTPHDHESPTIGSHDQKIPSYTVIQFWPLLVSVSCFGILWGISDRVLSNIFDEAVEWEGLKGDG